MRPYVQKTPWVCFCRLLRQIVALSVFLTLLGAASKTIDIKWPSIEGAVKYQIEIAKDAGFKRMIIKRVTRTNHFKWKPPSIGVFYFHVAAIDEDGDVGSFSPVAVLKFFPPAPEIGKGKGEERSALVVDSGDKQMKFEWAKIKGAKSYEFQLSSDPKFKKILIKKSVKTPNVIIDRINIENLYWRVRGVLGTALKTNFSTNQEVEVEIPEKDYKFYFSLGYAPMLKVQKTNYGQSTLDVDSEWNNAYVSNFDLWLNTYFGFLGSFRSEVMDQDEIDYSTTQATIAPSFRLFFDSDKRFRMISGLGLTSKEVLRLTTTESDGVIVDKNQMLAVTPSLALAYKPWRHFEMILGGAYMHPIKVDGVELTKPKFLVGIARISLLMGWSYISFGYESFSEDWMFVDGVGEDAVEGEVNNLSRYYDVSLGFRL